jgi:hypothetical protein
MIKLAKDLRAATFCLNPFIRNYNLSDNLDIFYDDATTISLTPIFSLFILRLRGNWCIDKRPTNFQ